MSASHPHSGPESRSSDGPDVNYFIALQQIMDVNRTAPIDANFLYKQDDPYAVEIVFHYENGSVIWAMGRELLINGMYEPAGDGDVTVCPDIDSDGKAITNIALWPPSEHDATIFTAHTRDLAIFLDLTLDLVPQGYESLLYDVGELTVEQFLNQ